MDIAIAGMSKARHGKAVLLLELGGKGKQILQPTARHHDVFVQLRQTSVTQGVGEFAPNLPQRFALVRAQPDFHKYRSLWSQEFTNLAHFALDGGGLAVQFDNEVGTAVPEKLRVEGGSSRL